MKIYGLYLETGCFSAACVEKKRCGHAIHTVTQSLSLSHLTSNLWNKKSSKKIFVALVLSQQLEKTDLELPPELPQHETAATVQWLIEQQGYTPMSRWFWDYRHISQNQVQVLLYDKEPYDHLIATLHPNPEKLHIILVCDRESLDDVAPVAQQLMEKYRTDNALEHPDSALVAVSAALACAERRHV